MMLFKNYLEVCSTALEQLELCLRMPISKSIWNNQISKKSDYTKKASLGLWVLLVLRDLEIRKPKEYQMLHHSTDFVSTFLSQKVQIHDG